jgi:DNA mismatch repair protein MutS
VARLAGLPQAVIERAREVLTRLESAERSRPTQAVIDDLPLFSAAARPSQTPTKSGPDPLAAALAAINPDEMTPREALEALYSLRKLAKS